MKNHLPQIGYGRFRNSKYHIVLCIIGILADVLPAFASARLGMPFYLDTIGTIGTAILGGVFPGIVVAVVSNALCMMFNNNALYFAFINALVAIYSSWFSRKYTMKKIGSILIYTANIAAGCGVLTALVQQWMFGEAQNVSVGDMTTALSAVLKMPYILSLVFVSILVNLLDKGLSITIALLAARFVSQDLKEKLREADWKQKPLSKDELVAMRKWSRGVNRPIWKRMMVTLVIVTMLAIILMGGIGVRLYFENEKDAKTVAAKKAAEFAAEIVDADRIDEFIRDGRAAEGYEETEDMLYRIRDNAQGVTYLYVIKIEDDGCYVAFDLETEDTPPYLPGEVIEFEEAFEPYLPALFAGEEIDPIESDDISGWVQTVYYPIKNEQGVTKGYVGADVSLEYMAGMMSAFVTKVLLILAGFLILILAYGMWTTSIYSVYPVGSIALSVDELARVGDDQKRLDESVRNIRALDIHTGDEVEKLYEAICTMALNQAEQMRTVRHFSEATAQMQDGLIITMADMVENRDSDTGAHIQKTAAYVRIIAEGLQKKGYYSEKITPKFISDIVRSAPLHDVGKINIPDEVLNKPGKLTDEEFEIMKTHTSAGKKIIEKAINTIHGENYLKEARNMAAYHHERWDGKGYPEGLHGEVIPLSARIMAVADVFDALTSPRIYKPAFPLEKALSIIEEGSGTQFDPKCVEVFMDNLADAKIILKKYNQFE